MFVYRRLLYLMFYNPADCIGDSYRSLRYIQNKGGQFFLRVAESDPIALQYQKQHGYANAFISVNESVVLDKP